MVESKATHGLQWAIALLGPCLITPAIAQPGPAQPRWQSVPADAPLTINGQPTWQPLSAPVKSLDPVQWQALPADQGLPQRPIEWQPVPDAAEGSTPEPSPSQPVAVQATPRQIPTSQKEADALLRSLPLSWADYPPMLRLGMMPTANILDSSDIQLTIGQVSPFRTGEGAGTGLQNYAGYLEMGLAENLQLSAFYTQADDPLISPIPTRQPQPENRWDVIGGALRWRLGQFGPWTVSVEGALESFDVKSGGTNSFGATSATCNIFNANCGSAVENNNLVGSFVLPISWKPSRSWELSLSTGVNFLPGSQGNANGSGTFYGTNVFVGAGVSYRPDPRVQLFASSLFPLGSGSNSFNSDLVFQRVPIFAGGMRYSLNPRIALEGLLTNGYGLTPSTAILALPSSNQILYSGRLIYTPTRPDAPPVKRTQAIERLSFGGLSVANANLLAAGTSRLRVSFDSNTSIATRYDVGFSDEFNFDLEVGQVSTSSNPSSPFATSYLAPGNATVRGGGTALFFSQPRGDAISSALRMSYGRVLAESRPGYQFVEWINSYQLSQSLSFNLNPKLAWSGSETPYGLGLSANWQLNPWLSMIPEGNLAAHGGQSNWTLALRACPSSSLCIDLYGSSALSFQDAGQLLAAANPSVGLSMGWKF